MDTNFPRPKTPVQKTELSKAIIGRSPGLLAAIWYLIKTPEYVFTSITFPIKNRLNLVTVNGFRIYRGALRGERKQFWIIRDKNEAGYATAKRLDPALYRYRWVK